MSNDDFWMRIDRVLEVSSSCQLTEDERKYIAKEEQSSYEANLDEIREILGAYEVELQRRGFWTECLVDKSGMRFRYSLSGYYGPGGFSSQFHIAGPLVLGEIVPHGDAIQSFYKNDLDLNIQTGADFEPTKFVAFIERNIESYLSLDNMVVTRDQYDRLRNIYPDQ